MANSAAFPLGNVLSRGRVVAAAAEQTLERVGVGTAARVVALDLDAEMADWLRAVGIAEGDEVTVLRRGVFGGPLHVRTGCGGEFALNRGLARAIATRASRR